MKRKYILLLFVSCFASMFSGLAQTTLNANYSDPLVVKYLKGGVIKNGQLNLFSNSSYINLQTGEKQRILQTFVPKFKGCNFVIHSGKYKEIWMFRDSTLQYIDCWNLDSLKIEDYQPLVLQRSGGNKLYYYLGGQFNGGKDNTVATLNLRGGSFLYKNYLDASIILNLGYMSASGEGDFSGDVGIMSRGYLPLRIKKINLAPYLGAGINYSFAPSSYFEMVFYAGTSWFVGPGSLDIGVQYGIKSKFALNFGYTFRPNFNSHKKSKK